MSFLETKYKRKSAFITAFIAVLIVVLIFNFGMSYFDPPIEYGISVNFGTTDYGSGNEQPKEVLKPMTQEPEEEVEQEDEIIEETTESKPTTSQTSESVITQNNEDAVAIKKHEDDRKRAEAEESAHLEEERIAKEKKEAQAKKKREQEAKRKKLDAMMGGLNTKGKATGGEGDDNKPGDKGKITGDPNASGYYGVGGSGSDENYRLGNRKALIKPEPLDNCNVVGTVYVKIWVDRKGNVIAAQPGDKGTTETTSCLLESARKAAMKTKFSKDNKASAKQIGLIIYEFAPK